MSAEGFKYLVNLDTLLDVRLATVSMLDAKYASTLLFNDWSKRETDFFKSSATTFTEIEYEKLVNSGDIRVLQHALPTTMTRYLHNTIKETLAEAVVGGSVNRHHVIVNTHPYQLTREELDELVLVIEEKLPLVDKVSTVSIPLNFLTPDYLKALEITHFINYDFAKWLDLYIETLLNSPMPSMIMICPKLTIKTADQTEDPEVTKALLEDHSAFSAMELQFVMYLGLRFIDVSYFSVLNLKPT